MNNTYYFFLNGQKYTANSELTLLSIIDYFGYNSSLLVIEYNNFICNKKNWKNINIQNMDKIELITIVGGG